MKNKLMVDIETTGRAPGCRVLSIAAFGFSKTGEQVYFYRRFNIAEQATRGFTDDDDTMAWWNGGDASIREEAFSGTESTEIVIAEFKTFFYKNFSTAYGQNFQAWCCGTDFDFPILKKLFNIYGFELPWKFYTQFDYRTIKNIFPDIQKAEENKGKHSALEDAMAQMRGLRKFFETHPEAAR